MAFQENSHGSSAGWVTGLCFHMFIYSSNNNSWHIYSGQEVQTKFLFGGGGSRALGFGEKGCCWERHGPAAIPPGRVSRGPHL